MKQFAVMSLYSSRIPSARKSYSLSVLAGAVALLLSAQAQAATTILVTTLIDEDGENPAACSLREAMQASYLKVPYGGCVPGKRGYKDIIQLEKGTYILTRGELSPSFETDIRGAKAQNDLEVDPIKGVEPQRLALATTLQAQAGARIFNTARDRASLSLSNLILTGGSGDLGGTIRAGGSVALSRVEIHNSQATQAGGAIYLEGTASTLSLDQTLIDSSQAPVGSVVSMSCLDNLTYVKRNLTFTNSSIINNGSASSTSAIYLCGLPTASFTSVTIGKNTVSTAPRSGVISFQDDGTARVLGQLIGADFSSLSLLSSTLMENTGNGLVYDGVGTLTLNNNVLAFSKSGKSCAYVGTAPLYNMTGVGQVRNMISSNAAHGICDLPGTKKAGAKTDTAADYEPNPSNVDAAATTQAALFRPLADYGAFLPGFLPIRNYTGGTLPAGVVSAVDQGITVDSCSSTDQRGVSRFSGFKRLSTSAATTIQNPVCDIGALELSQLTANDDTDTGNQSYVQEIERKIDIPTIDSLTDMTLQAKLDLIAVYKLAASRVEKFVQDFKSTYRYRQTYIDIERNDIPYESASGTTSVFYPFIKTPAYTVTAESFGTGPDVLLGALPLEKSANASNVSCVWNASMRHLLIARLDGTITPGGDVERCRYTIKFTDPATGKLVTSEGVVQTRIVNSAPIAKNDSYTLTYGASGTSMDLLANDSDDGDGPMGVAGQPANRTMFYTDTGKNVNIKIKTQPQVGKVVFERSGPCPDNDVNRTETTCYGGKATYVNTNLFNPFNDNFTYVVLDPDKTESNEATVTITNTATTVNDTRQGKSSGGGAIGVFGLLGLMGIGLARQRKFKR